MPCYVQIRIYQEEFEDIASMRKAAEAMNLRIENKGNEMWIGGSIKVTQKSANKYTLSTSNELQLRGLMDEYAAAKVMKEARRKNMTVKKEKSSNGEIKLKIVQN